MKPAPEWGPAFRVGHPTIDRQHRDLLDLCRRAVDACESDPECTAWFHLTLHDLAEGVRSHFQTEEDLLSRHNFPGLEKHREEHFAYEHALTDIAYSATCGKIDKEGLKALLLDWWTTHILETDMQYRDFLQATRP